MAQHLLFDAGGLSLAAPADMVMSVHESLAVQAVAGTCHWFRGLAVAHGKLLPVTDIGAYAGRRSSTGRTLELDPSVGIAGLQVDSVYGLSDLPISSVAFDEKTEGRREANCLALTERSIVQGERVHRVLDVVALVQSPEFLNIAETTD